MDLIECNYSTHGYRYLRHDDIQALLIKVIITIDTKHLIFKDLQNFYQKLDCVLHIALIRLYVNCSFIMENSNLPFRCKTAFTGSISRHRKTPSSDIGHCPRP